MYSWYHHFNLLPKLTLLVDLERLYLPVYTFDFHPKNYIYCLDSDDSDPVGKIVARAVH